MSDQIASIHIDAILDFKKAEQQLKEFQKDKHTIKVGTDQSELVSLNSHLKLKRDDLKSTVDFYKRNPLKVYTDQSQLRQLNKDLKELSGISFNFDNTEILKELADIKKEFQATKLKLTLDTSYLAKQIEESFRITIKSSSFQTQLTLKDNRNNAVVVTGLKNVEKAVNSTKKGVLGTIGTGLLESTGSIITRSIVSGLKKDLNIDVNQIARPFTKFVGKPLSKITPKSIKVFEDSIVSTLEEYFVFKNPEAAEQKFKDALKPAIEEIQEIAYTAIGQVLKVGAYPLKIRKRVLLAQSAQQAEKMSQEIEVINNEKIQQSKSISLITGGINYEKGGQNTFFASNAISKILPGSYRIPVTNPYSNDSENLGFLFEKRKELFKGGNEPMPLDMLFHTNIEKGYNPDSVKMAAHAIAYRKNFPDKPLVLSGSSGGSYVVEEAIAILERAGIKNVKGLGITAPLNNLMVTANPSMYQANVGDQDYLNVAMFGGKNVANKTRAGYQGAIKEIPHLFPGLLEPSPLGKVIPGAGADHALLPFLSDPTFQKNIQDFLGDYIDEIPKELSGRKGIVNLNFYKEQGNEEKTIPRTLAAVFKDPKTLKQIEKENFIGAEGYTFAVPQKPEWRRDNDFKAMIGNLPKESSLSGVAKEDFKKYNSLLLSIEEGLKEFLDSGGKVKQKLVSVLSDAVEFYPELENVQKQVLNIQNQYLELVEINKTPKNIDNRTPKQKYKDLYRQQRIEQQYPDGITSKLEKVVIQKPVINQSDLNVQKPEVNLADLNVQKASSIATIFRENYVGDEEKELTGIKNLIKQSKKTGDLTEAIGYAQNIKAAAIAAKRELTELRKSLGDQEKTAKTSEGKGYFESVNAYIGQISAVENKINKEFKKIEVQLPNIAEEAIAGFAETFKTDKKIEKAVEENFENVVETAQNVLEIESPSKVFKKIADQVVQGFQQGLSSFQNIDVESLFTNFVDNVKDLVFNFTKLGTGFLAFTQLLPILKDFASESLKVAINFQTIEKNVKNLSGTFNAVKDVQNNALKLNLNIEESLQGASQLYGATLGSNLEGEQTTQIIKNFQTFFASRDLNKEQQQRANLAISQSASKGISSEEIRQQLAEAAPGSFQILARSQGLSTQQLDRKLRKGALPVEDLIKFSQQAASESQIGIPSSLNTVQSSINKLDNSVLLLQKNVGNALLPFEKIRLDALSTLTNLLSNNSKLLISIGLYFTAWASSPLWKYLLTNLLAIKINFSAISLNLKAITFDSLVLGVKNLTVGLFNAVKPMAILAGKFLLFQGVISLIGQLSNRFKDLSGEIGEVAKQSSETVKQLEKIYNVKPQPQIKKDNNEFAESFSLYIEREKRNIKNLSKLNIGQNLKDFDADILGGIFTGGESFFDQKQRIKQTKDNIQKITNNSRQTRIISSSNKTDKDIEKLNLIDNKILNVQSQKNALIIKDPTNDLGIKNIDKETGLLLNQRLTAVKDLSELQSNISLRIEELKKSKKAFEELAKNSSDAVTQKEYLLTNQRITEELEQQEKLQDRINKAVGKNQTAFDLLKVSIENIGAKYQDFLQTIENINTNNKTNLLKKANINEITQGNYQYLNNLNDVSAGNLKAKETLENLNKIRSLLNSEQSLRVLNANKVNKNTGVNQLNLISQRLGEDPSAANDKYIIDQYSSYKQQLIDFKTQILQIEEAKNNLITQLKENTKQVAEYYESISREVKKSEIDFEISINNINKIAAQNDIRKTLLGVSDNIYTQFAETLIQSIEELNEIENLNLDNKSKILNAQFQIEDSLKQGIELSRSIPGDLPKIPVSLDFKNVAEDKNVKNLNSKLQHTNELNKSINKSFINNNEILNKTTLELEKGGGLFKNWELSLDLINSKSDKTYENFSKIGTLINNQNNSFSGLIENSKNFVSNLFNKNETNSQNGLVSPLRNVSIERLLQYKPSVGQGFYGVRDGGKRQHSKVDFDSRVGGGQDAIAQAAISGIATKRQITGTSGGVDINSKLPDGKNITVVYNHLRIEDLNKLFGSNEKLQINPGQALGRVTKDALSSGAHLDFGIKINGRYVDPQKYLAANKSQILNQPVENNNLKSNSFQNSLINLVKGFEGFKSKAYYDHGQYSVGYGTRAVSKNETITEKEATIRLNEELRGALNNVLSNVKVKLTDNQTAALTSLVYNAGSIKNFPKLLNAVNTGNFQDASKEFLDINKASGSVLSGLTTRRKKESEIFANNPAAIAALNNQFIAPGKLQEQVAQGVQLNNQNIQERTNLEIELNKKEAERRLIEIQRNIENAVRTIKFGARDQYDQDISSNRQVQDSLSNITSIKSPLDNYNNQIIQIDRDFDDKIKERQRRLQDVINEQITSASKLLENPTLIGDSRKTIESGLQQLQLSKIKIEREIKELDDIRKETKTSTENVFTFQEIFRKQKLLFDAINDDLKEDLAIAENRQRVNPLDYSRGNPLEINKEIQLNENNLNYLNRNNEIFNSSELDVNDKSRENVRNLLLSFRRAITADTLYQINKEQQNITDLETSNDRQSTLESFKNQPKIDLLNARAQDITDLQGNEFAANALSRQAAIFQENIRYAKELRDIQIQILQFKSQGIDTTGLDNVKNDLEAIHNLNIKKINIDFKDFKTTVESIAKDALRGLSQSLTDLILKGGSVADVFDNLFNTVLSGILNAGLSSLLGGIFYDGGVVPNYAKGGIHGISKAMDKERLMSGRKPVLAVVHAGELQIPADRVKELNDSGLSPEMLLGNFAEGGVIGNSRLMKSSAYTEKQPTTIKVESVVINNQEYVSIQQFQQGIEKAVQMGAEGGEKRVQTKLVNSPSFRRSVGL